MKIKKILRKLGFHKIPFAFQIYGFYQKSMVPNHDVILPFHGKKIHLKNPKRSYIARCIYLTGYHEEEVSEFIVDKIKPGMTILDVGAHNGYYTLLFAIHTGEKGQVLAFEPVKEEMEYIHKNIELNRMNNIKTFNFALYDKTEKLCLEKKCVRSQIKPHKKKSDVGDIYVKTNSFDKWSKYKYYNKIDLIKIDVEGAELNVLKGMKKTLSKDMPDLLIETHVKSIKNFGYIADDMIKFLKELGYQIRPVDKAKIDFSQDITLYCFK